MAMSASDDPNADPSQQDWQDQIRQQILAQQSAEPTADATPSPAASTPSPDFNTTTATAAPTYATSYGDGTTSPDQETAPEPPAAAPRIGAPDTPAPGNDANQIQGWASKWLGHTFSQQTLDGLKGQPLDLVMHDIANSEEARLYAQKNQIGPYAPASPSAAPSAGLMHPVETSGGAYGLTNGYATVPSANDPNQAWKDSIRKIILSRLQADQGPVDPHSPQIEAALNASKDAYTRQNTEERNALAERLYAQGGGLNTDAVTQQIQQSNERTGTAQSQLHAQLLMSAYKDKFTELNHLLDLATQTGDTESARQIQVTLANLQAAIAREGIGANLAEFGATMDQNAFLAGQN